MYALAKKLIPQNTRSTVLNFLYRTPPCIIQGRLLNRIGFNLVRAIYFHIKYLLRRPIAARSDTEQYVQTLKKDGIVMIENFLGDEQFASVVGEYETLYPKFTVSKKILVPEQRRYWVSKATATANEIEQSGGTNLASNFLQTDTLRHIVERASRRKIGVFPAAAYTEERYRPEDIGKDSQNLTIFPHFDVPYHSYKAFFYLDDVEESNGVFHYSKGSHRFSLRRLLLEYFSSVNIANKRSPQVNYKDSKHFEVYEKAMTPMVGKKNTLVIFDAMGIHKRGTFSKPTPRRMVQICFRCIESIAGKHSKKVARIIKA